MAEAHVRDFGGVALFRALDDNRAAGGLSWRAVANQMADL